MMLGNLVGGGKLNLEGFRTIVPKETNSHKLPTLKDTNWYRNRYTWKDDAESYIRKNIHKYVSEEVFDREALDIYNKLLKEFDNDNVCTIVYVVTFPSECEYELLDNPLEDLCVSL